jgi:hypothetical protein
VSLFVEKPVFTRRQFFKGAGILLASVVIGGIFAKLGFDAKAVQEDYVAKRVAGLYTLDESMTIRRSHDNPEIIQLYREFLSPGEVKPLSERSEHLLHTRYGRQAVELAEELRTNTGSAA